MSKCMPIDTAINVYNCTTQAAIDRFMAATKTPENLKIAQRFVRPRATKPYQCGHFEFTVKNDSPAKAAVARALVKDAGLQDLISRVVRALERPSDKYASPTVHFFANAVGVTIRRDASVKTADIKVGDHARLVLPQARSADDALQQRESFDALVDQWNNILIERGLSRLGVKPPHLDILLTAPPAYLTQPVDLRDLMLETPTNSDRVQRD